MNQGPTIARRGRIAVLALVALGAFAGSGASTAWGITPTIVNGSRAIQNNTTSRESGQSANHMEVLPVVKADPGVTVTGVRVDTDYNSTDNSSSATLRTLNSQQSGPSLAVDNFDYSRGFLSFANTASSIDCGDRPGFTHTIYMRAVMSDGSVTPSVSASVFFTPAGGCTFYDDYPFIYAQNTTSPVTLTKGDSRSFTFKGDNPDSGDDFDGYNWRLRRVSDGATTAETKVCTSAPDNSTHTVTPTFNRRGHWILEAELRRDGCDNDESSTNNRFWRIGSADVNTAAADSPDLTLAATRPQTGGTTTVTATATDPDDSSEGGAVQILEWDKDGNGSYEVVTIGSSALTGAGAASSQLTAGEKVTTIDTTGKTPGTYTVGARVTDNGALSAADSIRRQKTATTTYTVNSPPVLTASSPAATNTGVALPLALSATDANGDTRTYSVTTGPSHGGGSFTSTTGASTTYNYTPTAGYAGTDSITFQVSDGFGGTDSETVTINVSPDTSFVSPPATTGTTATFDFTTNATTGTPTFECSIDSAAFAPCSAPQAFPGLSGGPHNVRARATAGGETDQTPASHDFTVDATGPTTTLDTYPDALTNETTAGFSFTANESPATFECNLDDAGFTACDSPEEYPGLVEGPYNFKIRATDQYGNTGATVSYDWTVDLTPPDTNIVTKPEPSPKNSQMASFTYSSTEPTGATFECRLDSAPSFTPCNTQPQTYSGLAQGSHTFRVRAIDQAGNPDPTEATYTWVVDTVAPDATIFEDADPAPPGCTVAVPANTCNANHRTTSQDASFDYYSNDPNATFQCRLDNDPAGFTACTPPPKTYSGLADGNHKFEVRAVDVAGNVDPTPDAWLWSVHSGLPDTIIDSGPPNPTNSQSAAFIFHPTIPDSTFTCKLDTGPEVACSSGQSYGPLDEGQHTFTVTATDEFGRVDPTPTEHVWTIDRSAPDTVIDDKPLNPSNSDAASFTYHSSEGATSTFECDLDELGWEACDTQPKEYTGLSEGPHTFRVRATDEATNTDQTPAPYTWVVDTEAPETTITDQPGDPSRIVDPTFKFTSDEDPVEFFCQLDTGPVEPCTTDHQVNSLSETSHTFSVYAVDEAGNVGDPDTYTWLVDLTPPNTEITSSPGTLENTTSATFEFESDPAEPNGSFECRLNFPARPDFAPCASGDTFTGDAGWNKFEVRALDEAGNWDPSPDEHVWTIDTTGPTATIADPKPSDPTNGTTAVFNFSGSDNHSDAGDLTFDCELNGTPIDPCSSGTDFGPATEGENTFKVRATDEAGNTGEFETYQWDVDLTPPTVTFTSTPDALTNNPTANFAWESDEDPSTFECRFDLPSPGAWFDCGTSLNPVVSDGTFTFNVRATDAANNLGEATSYTWTVDTADPTVTIDAPTPLDPTNLTAATFNFTGSDNHSVAGDLTFDCELNGTPIDPCTSGTDFGPATEGENTFKVRATDEAGNTGDFVEHTWTVDTADPTATIDDPKPGDPTKDNGAVFNFSGTDNHSDAEDLIFDCELNGTTVDPCSSGDDFGPAIDGLNEFKVRATDEAGNHGEYVAYEWTFDRVRPTVVIDAPTPTDPTNSTAATFNFTGSDNHSDAGDLTFDCYMNGAAIDPCSSGTDFGPAAEGENTFDVRVTDEAGNYSGYVTYIWEVDTTDPTVSIDAPKPANPTNSTSADIFFTTGGDPVTTECDIDGAGFSACTASPQIYPGLSDDEHTVTVKVTDAAGNDATDTHTWTVDTAAPDTNITGGQPADPTNLTSADFTFTSTQSPSTFECKLDTDASFGACPAGGYTNLPEGSRTFEVRATDAANNTDPTPASYDWVIDTTAPTANITGGPTGITNQTAASFDFTTAGSPATTECQLDTGGFAPCTSPQAYSTLADGPHTITVKVTDAAGNSSTDDRAWSVDTGPPDTTIDSGPSGSTGSTSASFDFSASETGGTYECRLDSTNNADWAPCTTPKSYPSLAVGSHTFEVRATDVAGNLDASPATRTWTITPQVLGKVAASGAPVIKRRVRALNVPGEGLFQIATVTCRSTLPCRVTKKEAKIKIGSQTYSPEVTVEVVAKESVDTLQKGEIAQVVVHFPPAVQSALVSQHLGQLVVKLAAETEGGGGSSVSKKIKLKAKWLKKVLAG